MVHPAGLIAYPNGNCKRVRRWIRIQGLSPPSQLGVFNNTLDNGYRAFSERYMLCNVNGVLLPALNADRFDVHSWYISWFGHRLSQELNLPPVATLEQVRNAYTGPKFKLYSRALEQLYRNGLSQADAALHSFVKFEKQAVNKAPRVINPRAPEFNLSLGQFLKFSESHYFDAIARVFGQRVVVFKGLTHIGVAEEIVSLWDTFADPVAVDADATKFDMHCHYNTLVMEHIFYLMPYVGTYRETLTYYEMVIGLNEPVFSVVWSLRHRLAWLLSKQLVNSGVAHFADGKLKFTMVGTRSSGDLNTSLGNCLIMCANVYEWSLRAGIRVALVNNGDDCVLIVERMNLQSLMTGIDAYFTRKGFRMKFGAPVDVIEGIRFCQASPVFNGRGYSMVREPDTFFQKATMCLRSCPTFRALRRWVMAVGVCEGSLYGGIPVLSRFAAAYRRNGVRVSKRYIRELYRGTTRGVHATLVVEDVPIVDAARISFFQAFGISPDEQRALEAMCDRWSLGDHIDDHAEPVYQVMSYLLSPSI